MKQGMQFIRQSFMLLILSATVLAACSSNQVDKSRSEAFKQYETIIRWSQWDAAADFIDPEYQAEHPITRLEMDRLRLFRVTAYTIRSTGIALNEHVDALASSANESATITSIGSLMRSLNWSTSPAAARRSPSLTSAEP